MMKVRCIENKDKANDEFWFLEIDKVYDVVGETGICYKIACKNDSEKVWHCEKRLFEVVEENKTDFISNSEVVSTNTEYEKVKHPSHYNKGIEVWDFIISHDLNFIEGNIVKYVARHRHKNGIEDLKKARFYLDKLIEVTENGL